MPEIVAVQILSDRVVLAGAGGADAAELTELASSEIPEGQEPLEVAAAMVRQRRVENIGLALLVGWDGYSVRDVWLPFANDSQIRSTIKFELEDDLDISADQLLLPFQVLEQRPDASHVLAWGASKETIGGMLKAWETRGLSPEYMPPDALGHVGLVEALAGDLAGQPVVAVSGDEHSVHLTLLQGQQIWARRRLLGFAWATDAAGRPLQEIRRTFLGTPGFPEPAAVVSFGGEPADTLAGVIARDLGVPHRPIAPPRLEDGSSQMYWPLAAGVALFMARHGERPLSFRLEEFEPKETAQAVSLLAVFAMGLLGVVLLVGGFLLQLGIQSANDNIARMRREARTFWDSEVNAARESEALQTVRAPSLAGFRKGLGDEIVRLTGAIQAARSRPNAIKRWTTLADRMGRLPQSISIEPLTISITPEAIAFSGKAANSEAFSEFNKHLNESKDLVSDPGNATEDAGGEVRFNLRITYRDAEEAVR